MFQIYPPPKQGLDSFPNHIAFREDSQQNCNIDFKLSAIASGIDTNHM